MILKKIDNKDAQIETLQKLLQKSTSEKQQEAIQLEYLKLKNGYESEKENAYLIDFYLKDSKNTLVLHDLRLSHNGMTAQIDHLLINKLEIVLLESKFFSGLLEIKNDGSLEVSYEKKVVAYPNPIEQSKRHLQVLKDMLKDGGFLTNKLHQQISFRNQVIINPKTKVKNENLPKSFLKADSFISHWKEEKEKISLFQAIKLLVGMKSEDTINEIAKFLISQHVPYNFNYEQKYKITKEEVFQKEEKSIEIDKDTLPLCIKLKEYRKTTAASKNIKPYIVFINKTLDELLEKLPTTKEELLSINGFEARKIQDYGDDILRIIIEFKNKN